MNKNQLNKAITNLQAYVDDKIDKLPVSYEEKLLITVPKESIDKSKADAATVDNSYIIDIPKDKIINYVEGMFNNADLVIEYNGKNYICDLNTDGTHMECRVSSENNIFMFMIPIKNGPMALFIYKLDTTNITDIKLYMRKKNVNINDLTIDNSISIGRTGDIGINSSAIGYKVTASGKYSHAEGGENNASGNASHAEGIKCEASKTCSHAEGIGSTASGKASHAEGSNTTAAGSHSHAEGYMASAAGNSSHAEGEYTIASGDASHAEGASTIASGNSSHAEGGYTTASGNTSHAEGYNTKASSEYQHVQGKFNIEDTANKYAHIVGNGSSADNRSNAHTLDWNGNAWYAGDVQANNVPYTVSSKVLVTIPANDITNKIKINNDITVNNTSINKDRRYYIKFLGSKKLCSLLVSEKTGNTIMCGINNYKIEAYNDSTNITLSIRKINKDNTTTDTFTDLIIYEEEVKYLDSKYLETDLVLQNSISLGRVGDIGVGSSAVGYNVAASGDSSHAEGAQTTASGNSSHAEGYITTASGESSHAEGSITIASGGSSHAEGAGSSASAYCSHAEGDNVTASGDSSHAEGNFTTASGDYSHAEGNNVTASGNSSHAEGDHTLASGQYQHVQGKYNIEDTANKYAHIVGNGNNYKTRSNAHTIDWNGNAWYQGSVYTGGTSQDDTNAKKLATEDYVNDSISSITVPTKTSDLTNDSGFITSIPSEYITETELTAKNYIDNTT